MASKPPLLSTAFVLGFLANFLHSLAFHSYLHLPGLLRQWDADELMIGSVMAISAGAGIVCRPWVGRAVDQRGRRAVLIAGSLLHLAVTAAYLTVDGIGPWLVLIRIGHGFAIAMLFTSLFTIAADIVPESRRTEGIAIYGLSGILPMSLAGLLGDAVLSRGSYTDLFVVIVVATAVGVAVGLPLEESRRAQDTHTVKRSFFAMVAVPKLRPLWFVGLGFALAIAAYFTFVKTFVLDTGFGSLGGFFTTYTVAAVVLRVFFGWVPDRVGPRLMLIPAMLSVSAGLLMLASASSDTDVLIAGALTGSGHAWVFPIVSALVVQRARDDERGGALAMFTALFDVGLLVGGPMYGAILRASSYTVTFCTAAGLAALATIVYFPWDGHVLASERRDAERDALLG